MSISSITTALVAMLLIITIASFRTPAAKENLKDLVMKNSKNTPVTFLELKNYVDFSKLKPLDAAIIKQLKRFKAYDNRGCGGCPVSLYYHSYFEFNAELTAAIFAKSNSGDDGTADQLVMAFINKEGNITDAFIAAEIVSYAECKYSITATIKKPDFMVSEKEDCVILPGNKNEGLSSIDSTTYFYSLNAGKLKLKNKKNVKLER